MCGSFQNFFENDGSYKTCIYYVCKAVIQGTTKKKSVCCVVASQLMYAYLGGIGWVLDPMHEKEEIKKI